jgi:hypothetical protein
VNAYLSIYASIVKGDEKAARAGAGVDDLGRLRKAAPGPAHHRVDDRRTIRP